MTTVVHSVAFQRTDIDGIVYHITAAVGLTGVLTYKGTGSGEGIVLANQLYRVIITAVSYQCNITGNIHMGRTERDTGDALLQIAQTTVFRNMGDEIIAKIAHTLVHHAGRFITDGTVGS